MKLGDLGILLTPANKMILVCGLTNRDKGGIESEVTAKKMNGTADC